MNAMQVLELIKQGLNARYGKDNTSEVFQRISKLFDAGEVVEPEDVTSERESENVALFDLDGTLADFDGAMTRGMRALAAPGETPWTSAHEQGEPPYLTARRRLVKQIRGFWSDLPRLEDGFRVLDMATELDFRIMVLSRGPRTNAVAWGEKLEWCRRNLAENVQVTLTEDKGLVYGRVLVDDWPAYILRWLEWRKRGLVIMPDREWNQGFEHPQVVRYIAGRNDAEVRQALTDRRR